MESAGESIILRPEVRKVVPILCDWDFLQSVYKFSLQHRHAEGWRGFIPSDNDSDEGWWTRRSEIETNADNIALRRLELEHTELPLSLGFVAIGLPVESGKERKDEKIVRWDNKQNTIWVQPPDIANILQPILDYERLAIYINPPNRDSVKYPDPEPIELVNVQHTSKQEMSPVVGLRRIHSTARLLKRSVGYKQAPDKPKKSQNKFGRNSRGASRAR